MGFYVIMAKFKPGIFASKIRTDQFIWIWELLRIEGLDKQLKPMTLEGCVVRISDNCIYRADIEDAIVVNLIRRDDIPEDIAEIIGNTNRDIVNNLIIDVINNSYNKNYITFLKGLFCTRKIEGF